MLYFSEAGEVQDLSDNEGNEWDIIIVLFNCSKTWDFIIKLIVYLLYKSENRKSILAEHLVQQME